MINAQVKSAAPEQCAIRMTLRLIYWQLRSPLCFVNSFIIIERLSSEINFIFIALLGRNEKQTTFLRGSHASTQAPVGRTSCSWPVTALLQTSL